MPDILGEKYDATLSLPYYRAQLQWTNPARFQYMDVPTQQATRVRLINTLALLRCEAQEHLGKKHTQQLLKVISEIDTCLSLLDAVSLQASSLLDDCNGALNITYLRDEAKAFLKAIKPNCSPSTNVSDIIEQDIGVLNRMRLLHFVFGTILFEVVFDVLAADNRHFSYETQLKSGITLFGPLMGFLSVFIYLLRFFLELKAAIQAAFFQDTQLQVFTQSGVRFQFAERTRWDVFWTEFGHRKYILCNDFFWGIGNLMTWLWLCGAMYTPAGEMVPLGFAGGVLICVLLFFDLVAVCFEFYGKRQDYKAELENVTAGIFSQDAQAILKQIQLNWKYEKYRYGVKIANAVNLVVGFAALLSFFLPVLPHALFVTLGAAICLFGFTVLAGFGTYCIDIFSIKEARNQRYHDAVQTLSSQSGAAQEKEDIKLLESLLKTFQGASGNAQRDLYLQIEDLLAQGEDDRKQVNFLWHKAWMYTGLHILTPVVIFTVSVFLPLEIALIPMAILMGLIIELNKYLSTQEPRQSSPRKERPIADDPQPYHQFSELFKQAVIETKVNLDLEQFHWSGNVEKTHPTSIFNVAKNSASTPRSNSGEWGATGRPSPRTPPKISNNIRK